MSMLSDIFDEVTPHQEGEKLREGIQFSTTNIEKHADEWRDYRSAVKPSSFVNQWIRRNR